MFLVRWNQIVELFMKLILQVASEFSSWHMMAMYNSIVILSSLYTMKRQLPSNYECVILGDASIYLDAAL